MTGVHVRLRVGGESYALPVENVLEVAELSGVSAIPGAGAAVLGIRNLRGHVLPVFDLARVLEIAGGASTPRVVVAEHHGRLAGLAVADVTDVVSLTADAEGHEAEALSGAVLEDGLLTGIIDVERLFATLAREAA